MGAAAILRAADVHAVGGDTVILEAPFDRLSATVGHRFEEMGLPASPAAQLLLFWGGLQQGFDASGFAPVEHAGAVVCPTLLIVGDRDRYVKIAEVRAIQRRVAGRADLEVVKGLGHRSLHALAPARWNRVVSAFLGRSLPAAARRSGAGDDRRPIRN
jgi:pimeloyl-ACP methyl ester carboxylesterase